MTIQNRTALIAVHAKTIVDYSGGNMIGSSIEGIRESSLFVRLGKAYPDHEVFVKLEGLNTAGSIKLKTAVALIDDLEKDGRLRPGGGVVESSSGSLGVALAAVCARRGYSLTIVTDPNANDATVAHMKALGARVEVVHDRDESGGYLGTRLARIRRLQSQKNGLVWTNQYSNAANSSAHSSLTYPAIVSELGDPDLIFVGAGTTGTLMGVVQGVRARRAHTEVYAIDSAGSVTFGGPPARRHIPGLGASVRPPIFDGTRVPHQYYVREEDAVRECRRVATREGFLPGGSTGTILSGFRALSAGIPEGSRIVVVAPDLGERYLNTVYNDAWVNQKFGSAALDIDASPMMSSEIYDRRELNVSH